MRLGMPAFPILLHHHSSNAELRSAIKSSNLLNVSGVKVGLFGLMTPDLILLSKPGEDVSESRCRGSCIGTG